MTPNILLFALRRRYCLEAAIFWLFVDAILLPEHPEASGKFEVQILEFRNPRGVLAAVNETCCSGLWRNRENLCLNLCRMYFYVCLREYQPEDALPNRRCAFGNKTSERFGGNSIRVTEDNLKTHFEFPFTFSWPRSYTLIIEIRHQTQETQDIGSDRSIEELIRSDMGIPHDHWGTYVHKGLHLHMLLYRIRITCDQYFYGAECIKICRPRNDRIGHYSCDKRGDKVCIYGWNGKDCRSARCRIGCHPVHGSCRRPDECRCAFGWRGALCDKCIPYPGCSHGDCERTPWTCTCHRNWGGLLCDKDLNKCEKKPCQHGALCYNHAPDEYTCACRPGYAGVNCQIEQTACLSQPCRQGATCYPKTNNAFTCECPVGWNGQKCQNNIDDCTPNPCLHDGVCEDRVAGYTCQCLAGWYGSRCHKDANECDGSTCIQARSCNNLPGGYTCDCLPGWSGKNCDRNIDDCMHISCSNGGVCKDMVNGYVCACVAGFSGLHCEIDVNECVDKPCLHGGRCLDGVAGFVCICARGFAGHTCQHVIDLCEPNPCANGGTCHSMTGQYYCLCQALYTGMHCERQSPCRGPNCHEPTNCSVKMELNHTKGRTYARSIVCSGHGVCVNRPGGQAMCLCDIGYTGLGCEIMLPRRVDLQSCRYNGWLYPHNTTWQQDCNRCHCYDGHIRCSQVWCGPSNCIISHASVRGMTPQQCPLDEECVIIPDQFCFTPPCLPRGFCQRMVKGYQDSVTTDLHNTCVETQVTKDCARIVLVFDKHKLPRGTSVESICHALRMIHSLQQLSEQRALFIMCDKNDHQPDSIDIIMSASTNVRTRANIRSGFVQSAVNSLVRSLNGRTGNQQTGTLSAVIRIELMHKLTSVENNREKTWKGCMCRMQAGCANVLISKCSVAHFETQKSDMVYIIPLVCISASFLGFCCFALIFITQMQRQKKLPCQSKLDTEDQSVLENRRNNQQDGQQLVQSQTFQNPVFRRPAQTSSVHESRSNSSRSSSTGGEAIIVTGIEVEFEKYEKLDSRVNIGSEMLHLVANDCACGGVSSVIKTDKKNINVQLALSRVLDSGEDT